MIEAIVIDEVGPLTLRSPDSVVELAELVRSTAAADQGLYPVGGQTMLDLGLPPSKPGIAVDTQKLARVVDYPARDLTVTVEAGITIAELQRTLAAEGQRLPVDVPNSDRATLGGALASNQSGPRRLGFGTLRDYVIGIRFMTDAGEEVKAGGQVVKNVAGYDLMKLQIGALGTLGILTQVTLKVSPKPEDRAMIAFGLSAAAVGPTLDRLHASVSRPVMVELLNATTAKLVSTKSSVNLPDTDPFVLIAGFEEKAVTVSWQLATLKDELKTAPIRGILELRGSACDPLNSALIELQTNIDSRFILKANVLPSRLAGFISTASANHPDLMLHAHAANGIAYAHMDSPELTVERASAMLTSLTPSTADANGRLTVRRCPAPWKKVLPIWGQPHGDRGVMRSVKLALDPNNLFNPGRLFGDL